MTEHTAPDETKPHRSKRDFFEQLALSHLPEMRLLFRGGGLYKKDHWRNVVEHCLVQIAVADELSDLIGLPPEEKTDLIKVAACHDWTKRLEKKPDDFTEEERAKAKMFLRRVNPNQNLMAATGPEIFERTLIKKESTFLERLQGYIDDITSGSEIVEYDKRIDEAEKRYPELGSNSELEAKLGGRFFDKVREFDNQVAQEIFERLPNSVCEQIGEPKNIPNFIRKQIERRWLEPEKKKYRFDVRSFTQAQTDNKGRKNEDALSVLENEQRLVAFVVDGATELAEITKFQIPKLGGAWAASTAKEGIEKNFSTEFSAGDLLLSANDLVARRLRENNIDPETTGAEFLPTSSGAVLVMIDKINNHLEIAQLGDAACLIVRRDGSTELALPLPVVEGDINALNLSRNLVEEKGISMKEAFQDKRVADYIIQGRATENQPDGKGYGALNGKKSARKYVRYKIYYLNEIKKVVLMTDGMVPPQEDYEAELDWQAVARKVQEGGLGSLFNYTHDLKDSDPDLVRYPRFKAHDDATAIVIDITKSI